ncbi:MAG: tryptophan 2,3-dioxygenase family protein [Chloroherpetonaceae bacterium]|nr:tryptophan 2,3-dioxygenase family protein [Chloroherpetonaceae bacterium]
MTQKNNATSGVYYGEYLQLEKILDAQTPLSKVKGKPAHDEMLFIVIHQVYELWFKQILHELDSVLDFFQRDYVLEPNIGVAVSRLIRITEIQSVMIDQLRVLETMAPGDFLDFREALSPASGFQSAQFRLIENKMGLRKIERIGFGGKEYSERLSKSDLAKVLPSEQSRTLFELIELWLERTPFLEFKGFDFWVLYQSVIEKNLARDQSVIEANPFLSPEAREKEMKNLKMTRENFEAIFDSEKHLALIQNGQRRLSHRASKAALLILLYKEKPILHLPYRLLTALIEIDERFATWRYRHFQMVHRMIGTKIGTGGSSGHHYLKTTVDAHRIFSDLFNLSTYLLPSSELPTLPLEVERELGFYYTP